MTAETAATMIHGIPFVELALFVFVLGTAAATAMLRDVLAAIIVFSAFSLGMAMYYTLLLAPDVGMTEAAVSAGVTTLLLLLTIAKTVHPSSAKILERINAKAVAVVGGFMAVIGSTLQWFPALGDPNSVTVNNPATAHYLAQTYADTGVKNTVSAVLAAYRGFDTLGEAIVVFTAGIAALMVLRQEVFTDDR